MSPTSYQTAPPRNNETQYMRKRFLSQQLLSYPFKKPEHPNPTKRNNTLNFIHYYPTANGTTFLTYHSMDSPFNEKNRQPKQKSSYKRLTILNGFTIGVSKNFRILIRTTHDLKIA